MPNENHADFTPSIPDSKITPEKAPYVPVGSFKFWAQKVLPTVYDDSLSYYEVLTKLVWHINKMIEDMDNFNQTIDNALTAYGETQDYVNSVKDTMIATYNELQDYVNHYFDSLDIQYEVNRKLDIMATNGTLTTLISPFIPNLVDTWLNEHVDPVGSAIMLNDTLTVSGTASDSKVVGDVIYGITGNRKIIFTPGGYIDLSGTTTDYSVVSNDSYKHAVIDCGAGSRFTINSSGGNASRSFAFVDSDGKLLLKAGAGKANHRTVTAPANSYKLVINAYTIDGDSYTGSIVRDRLNVNEFPIGLNRFTTRARNAIGINRYTEDITDQLTYTNDAFYQMGERLTLNGAIFYQLDCSGIETIILDRVTPAWYDVYTIIGYDGQVISYQYNQTSLGAVRDRVQIDVYSSGARYICFSDDSYRHPIRIMTIPNATKKLAYDVNITDSRKIGTVNGKFYYPDGIGTSNVYQYVRYDVLGLLNVRISANCEGWTNMWVLLDKDGNVIRSKYIEPGETGFYQEEVYVGDGVEIAISTLISKSSSVRVFTRSEKTTDRPYYKIGVIGDSWVEYNATNNENMFDLACGELNIDWLNYGISGTGFKATENNNTAYYQRANSVNLSGCNAVFICGSGNDNTEIANGHLGLATDSTSDTICGCANLTINTLTTRYPGIKVAIISPSPWETMPNSTNNNFKLYCEKLEEISKLHGIPFLNMYDKSNLRPWVPENKALYQPDGTHPNNAGHKHIYKIAEKFINEIVG